MSALLLLGLSALTQPPAAATALLAAIAAGDLNAARAALAEDVTIGRGVPTSTPSSLEAFAAHIRGCRQAEMHWDAEDQEPARISGTVTWTCPSRANARADIWTVGDRVVWIQFE